MRWFGVGVIWGFFAGLLLGLTAGTTVGPVIVTLPGATHGVHLGDLAALALSGAGATIATMAARRQWAAR